MCRIQEQFNFDREALAAACERVSRDVLSDSHPDRAVVEHLSEVADILRETGTWELQARAAASLRWFFHRDGLDDRPAPKNSTTWEQDLKLIWDLSNILVESRYREVADQHIAPADGLQPPLSQNVGHSAAFIITNGGNT